MKRVLLVIIVILGFSIRYLNISSFPVSLNWDEASHGYNAYSILKTGKDEWGINYPSIFRAFGDYKLPVYIYTLVPFVWIFGLSPFSVRLLSVIAGTFTVLGTYYLTNSIFNKFKFKSNLSLLAALFVAFSPWNIFVSRIAVEANLASTLIIWGVYFFLSGIEKIKTNSKSFQLQLSSLLFGLSMFTYNSARVFSPLLFASLVFIYWKYWGYKLLVPFHIHIPFVTSKLNKINKSIHTPTCFCHLSAFALMLFFVLLMIYQTLYTQGSTARLNNISLLDQGAINLINEARGNSNYPEIITKILYNKASYLTKASISEYFSYFNPNFWFYSGGKHYQFSLPGFPLLLWFSAPLILLGLFPLFQNKGKPLYLLFIWLLLAPIPASLTRDNPHALRILHLTPIPQIITAYGFIFIYKKIKSKIILSGLLITLLVIIAIQTRLFWRIYTNEYVDNYSWVWQSGNRQLVEYVKTNYSNYDHIYITKKYGEPHIFFAFYWPFDPYEYQNNKQWEYRDANTSNAWYWVNNLDKLTFVNDWEISNVTCPINTRCLSIQISDIIQPGWHSLRPIQDTTGKKIYYSYDSVL